VGVTVLAGGVVGVVTAYVTSGVSVDVSVTGRGCINSLSRVRFECIYSD